MVPRTHPQNRKHVSGFSVPAGRRVPLGWSPVSVQRLSVPIWKFVANRSTGTLLIVVYQVQKQACFVHLRIDLVTGGVALPLEQSVSCDFRMTAGGARHR